MNAIRELESINEMISADKAGILLVHGRLKPSALIVMQGNVYQLGHETAHITSASISRLYAVLAELGLSYVTTTKVMKNS
ncbi:MAG: hypothetical protein ABIP50_03035 [Candidatus Saccharimonadales bacterium]